MNTHVEFVAGKKDVCTEMVIAAHQDDIEIMCPQGILSGYQNAEKGLVAVVMADGAGSPRAGEFAGYTDEEMKAVRRLEQIEAARLGDYAGLYLLNRSSKVLKDMTDAAPTDDLTEILKKHRPEILYIHNLTDKHATHVYTALRAIAAVRRLPPALRPKKLYGCEVWRGLDWLPDGEKVIFDISGHDALLLSLLEVFRSQIAGGKRYDLAAEGRRRANATYGRSHSVDRASQAAYAMDLTALVEDDTLAPADLVRGCFERFWREVAEPLQ